MREYYVYILRCSDNSFYIGVCNDLNRRICEHQEGIDPKCYTWKKRPVKLVYGEVFSDIKEAIEREKQLKGWSRAKKQALIAEKWETLRYLAKSKNS